MGMLFWTMSKVAEDFLVPALEVGAAWGGHHAPWPADASACRQLHAGQRVRGVAWRITRSPPADFPAYRPAVPCALDAASARRGGRHAVCLCFGWAAAPVAARGGERGPRRCVSMPACPPARRKLALHVVWPPLLQARQTCSHRLRRWPAAARWIRSSPSAPPLGPGCSSSRVRAAAALRRARCPVPPPPLQQLLPRRAINLPFTLPSLCRFAAAVILSIVMLCARPAAGAAAGSSTEAVVDSTSSVGHLCGSSGGSEEITVRRMHPCQPAESAAIVFSKCFTAGASVP